METIGKKVTTLIQPDLKARARRERAQQKKGRNDFIFYMSCLLAYVAMAGFAIATGRGDDRAWLATAAVMSAVSTLHSYRGWLMWRAHKERGDMYETLAQDPNVMLVTGHTIYRIDPGEAARRSKFESDSANHDEAGSDDREAGGHSAGRDVSAVPADDH